MAATSKKIPRTLGFDIGAPLGMGLLKEEDKLGKLSTLLPWLKFSLTPLQYPDKQDIWLFYKPEDESELKNTDRKRRRLTADIEGSVSFITRRPESNEAGDGEAVSNTGTLSHYPRFDDAQYGHVEFYNIEIRVSEKDLNKIIRRLLSGKPPTRISIVTPDVEYGYAPDGSDAVWEVWETNHGTYARIVHFSLNFSTDIPRVGVGPKRAEDEEEREREQASSVRAAILQSREDIRLLCQQQATMNGALSGLRRQLTSLTCIMLFIAIVVALRSAL